MPSYTAPTKDMQFLLHDVLNVTGSDVPGYDEMEADFTSAVLEEAGKLASEVLQPLNVVGDTEGCTLENGVVRTPTGFKDAFDQVREGGWTGIAASEDFICSINPNTFSLASSRRVTPFSVSVADILAD